MTLTEIREELMLQHAGLRDRAHAVRESLVLLRGGHGGGTKPRDSLRDTVGALARDLEAHNAREEELLGETIRTIDAWGEARAALMDEHHRSEHDDIVQALENATEIHDDATAASEVERVLADLMDHMLHEEKEILSPSVLRDDVYTVDYGGG